MIAAFATLAFLAAGWIAIVGIARTLEEYGARARLAVSGLPVLPVREVAARVSPRYPARRPLRAMPRPALSAAA